MPPRDWTVPMPPRCDDADPFGFGLSCWRERGHRGPCAFSRALTGLPEPPPPAQAPCAALSLRWWITWAFLLALNVWAIGWHLTNGHTGHAAFNAMWFLVCLALSAWGARRARR